MNEQLQKALADILTMLQSSAQVVGDAAQQEIPLLVQEYLRWGWYSSLLDAAFALVVLAAVVVALKWVWRKTDKWESFDAMPGRTIAGITLGLLALFQFHSGVYAIYTAIQIVVAPRVYLLETVMQAVK